MLNSQKPFRVKLFTLLIPLVLVVLTGNSWAALPGYMSATGETQGTIEGSVTQAGREGTMEVVEFGHNVSTPLDATGSHLPTGKRKHRPIRIVKEIDKATPILMNVLTNNEKLTDVRIDFWKPSNSGKEFQYYTVELIDAAIISIIQHMGTEGDLAAVPMRETVTFSYRKIIWTWQDGGITAEDDWETPVQ